VKRLLRTLPLVAGLLASAPASAYDVNDKLSAGGYMQMWVTLWEQMEEAKGLYQVVTRDPAATTTSGFSLSRLRLGARIRLLEGLLEMRVQMRLEKSPAFLDAFVAVHPHRAFSLYVGQFKIPSAYENLIENDSLDFILRPTASECIADYGLSRGVFTLSHFSGVHSYFRDMGIAVKGDIDLGRGLLRYFLMVGNGLGANLFIGGGTKKEFIITNAGEFLVAARVEVADLFGVVTFGGHVTYNRHENIVFNSGRTVYDLDRTAYSADLRIAIPRTGLRIAGMWGGGIVGDEYDADGRYDMIFSGWEARIVFRITEPIRLFSQGLPAGHDVEIGARFDTYAYDVNESGTDVVENVWTFGIAYIFRDYIKVKTNYVVRRTHDPNLPELDDDAVILELQASL